jgi:HlyD family type I secretion membrane fusion protein
VNNPKEDQEATRPSSSTNPTVLFGVFVVFSIFIGLGTWSATALLSRAISAAATLTVKGDRKSIQHFEGGIVASLNVVEGQNVKKGDLLVALDPLHATASVARHNGQLNRALAREARLENELADRKDMVFSGAILSRIDSDPNIIGIIESEQRYFIVRRKTLHAHIANLDERIDQLDSEIKGLKIQRKARFEQYKIFQDEIVGLRELNIKGYYPKTKLLAVERAIAELRGAAGHDLAEISRATSSQQEAKNQIINLRQRFKEEVVKELTEIQIEIMDLNERLLVASDVLKRVEIKAPRPGIIQGIKVHTIGGVIKPGQVLMQIAPQDKELIISARVSPVDIDSIAIGQKAEIRLTALNMRTTPAIFGRVVSISGDSLTDESTGVQFFLVRIEIPKREREKLSDTKLTAGMPADVLILTGERTALDYILKPMTDAFARGLNEE